MRGLETLDFSFHQTFKHLRVRQGRWAFVRAKRKICEEGREGYGGWNGHQDKVIGKQTLPL